MGVLNICRRYAGKATLECEIDSPRGAAAGSYARQTAPRDILKRCATGVTRVMSCCSFLLLIENLPALALVSEVRVKNQLARTLFESYVGPLASGKILDGATMCGSGVTVDVAIAARIGQGGRSVAPVWRFFPVVTLKGIKRSGGSMYI